MAFLSEEAINFFAHDQLGVLRDRYLASGEGLTVLDAAVINGKPKVPTTFRLKDMWMFGCTKPTGEMTAVACTPPCRYHGNKKSLKTAKPHLAFFSDNYVYRYKTVRV